jgi:hypothetical protein
MHRHYCNIVMLSMIPLMVFILYEVSTSTAVLSQPSKYISITLANSSYAHLNSSVNQVKFFVNYDVENPFQNAKINGVMKVYASNGTLVKYSSFPNSFIANQTGVLGFKTSVKYPRLTEVIANVTIFDIAKKNALSNTITSRLILDNGSNTLASK